MDVFVLHDLRIEDTEEALVVELAGTHRVVDGHSVEGDDGPVCPAAPE